MNLNINMRKRDKLKAINEANQRLEEKWYHTLATTAALLASSQGELKAQSYNVGNQETEQVTETKAQKEIKAMMVIGQDNTIPSVYVVGKSPDIATAKKIALMNAKQELIKKYKENKDIFKNLGMSDMGIKAEVINKTEDGIEYHILFGK